MTKATAITLSVGLLLLPALFGTLERILRPPLPIHLLFPLAQIGVLGLLLSALVGPTVFLVWATRFARRGAAISWFAIAVFVIAAGGVWLYFSTLPLSSYGWWDVAYFQIINFAVFLALLALLAINRISRTFWSLVSFHWLLVGWLTTFAFPHLGELP